ncbi:hypothetical protein DEJ70_06285 [Wolbachia pipientis wAlbB]|nr:hypothetical protein DEJ70_06285 [Wolbachia pipientis wAlbB]QDW09088.1 hypothetical protein CO539_006250 [Wolbachia pipientis]QDW10287.1 hypothetical protein CO538_006260 [Wolbachia pipientis]THA19883.1 hypothetical protein EJE47_04565 [Wolbachia endosymbiont of Aedes albopictus]
MEEKEKRNHLQAITKDMAIRLKIWIDLSNFWMDIRIEKIIEEFGNMCRNTVYKPQLRINQYSKI